MFVYIAHVYLGAFIGIMVGSYVAQVRAGVIGEYFIARGHTRLLQSRLGVGSLQRVVTRRISQGRGRRGWALPERH